MVTLQGNPRDPRIELDGALRQGAGQRAHQRPRTACKPHGVRLLPRAGKALRLAARQAFDENIAFVVLWEGGEAKLRQRGCHRRVHVGPEPGRTEVETVLRWASCGIG